MKQFNLNSKSLELLSQFFLHKNQPLYVREIAKNLNWPASTVSRLLKNLESQELVHSTQKGNLKLLQLNSQHPCFPEIKNLVKKIYQSRNLSKKLIK